ncbi:MAG: hypothetical protein WBX25_15805, partial [Rhodomicrobium sp.]
PLYAEMTAELPPDVYEQLGEAVRKNEEAVRQAFEAFAKANQLNYHLGLLSNQGFDQGQNPSMQRRPMPNC